MQEREGPYMHTVSGHPYWPYDPRVDEVDIEVIAHHLSMQCRFNGAVQKFFSVAEHSYWCSFCGPDSEALERLLHDAAEAYIGDMIRPLKKLAEVGYRYRQLEFRNEKVIAEAFGLRYPWPPSVKIADEYIVGLEIDQLIHHIGDNPTPLHDGDEARRILGANAPHIAFFCWPPDMAKKMFLSRFETLMERRRQDVQDVYAEVALAQLL